MHYAGKVFDLVSFAAQESNATVFLSSESESKIGMRADRVLILSFNYFSDYFPC